MVAGLGGLVAALALTLLAQRAEDGGGAEGWVLAYAVGADEGLWVDGGGLCGDGSRGPLGGSLFDDRAPEGPCFVHDCSAVWSLCYGGVDGVEELLERCPMSVRNVPRPDPSVLPEAEQQSVAVQHDTRKPVGAFDPVHWISSEHTRTVVMGGEHRGIAMSLDVDAGWPRER